MNDNVFKILLIIGVGILIGSINGFFGGGGGMICVPLLLLLGLRSKIAHATAILTMLPISVASSIVYYSYGVVDWQIFLYVCGGSIFGGAIGAFILKKLSNEALSFIFSILMIMVGIRMCF